MASSHTSLSPPLQQQSLSSTLKPIQELGFSVSKALEVKKSSLRAFAGVFAGAGYFLRRSERDRSEGGRAKPALLHRWPEPLHQSEIEGEPRRSPVEGEPRREGEGEGEGFLREPTEEREASSFFFDIFCFLLQRG
jgi:hypothetical protein